MPSSSEQKREGLWGFKDLTGDPHNSMCLRIRFTTKVTPLHRKHVLDALSAWMMAQKMIFEHGGPIAPEDAIKMILTANKPKEH